MVEVPVLAFLLSTTRQHNGDGIPCRPLWHSHLLSGWMHGWGAKHPSPSHAYRNLSDFSIFAVSQASEPRQFWAHFRCSWSFNQSLGLANETEIYLQYSSSVPVGADMPYTRCLCLALVIFAAFNSRCCELRSIYITMTDLPSVEKIVLVTDMFRWWLHYSNF